MKCYSYFIFIGAVLLISSVVALAPINEVSRDYRSYEEAARQACLYILTGKIDPGPPAIDKRIPPASTLNHYPSRDSQPPWINGKIVGKRQTPTSDPVEFIRLDHDAIKGFHFSVQALNADRTAIDYTKVKLAAKFPYRAQEPDKYFQTLVEALNRKQANNSNEYEHTPMNIWDIWRSGKRP